MHQGKNDEAILQFKNIIAQYPWAQSFDPSRGTYWSVAEKSQASIDTMEGKTPPPSRGPPKASSPDHTGVGISRGRNRSLIISDTANSLM